MGTNPRFEINLSVPLVLEYEYALKRVSPEHLTEDEVVDVLDYLCSVAHLREIYFLWRPFLRGPKDDMVLELAVDAGCEVIVTHNVCRLRRLRSVSNPGANAAAVPG